MRPGLAVLGLLPALAQSAAAAMPEIAPLQSPVTVRLRGLSAFSEDIAWASGREGTVLHTSDGGRTWRVSRVPGAEALDFRDVQAFGADEAIVMGAGPGDASRIYRTTDGGATWSLVLRNTDATGFFDCIDFQGDEGRLLGDPVGGRFQLYASRDRGATWNAVTGPRAAEGEAAFAASGTCVKRIDGATLVVTGGAKARVHFLPDRFARKANWHVLEASGFAPAASAGLFSVAQRGRDFIAAGGDYKLETVPAPGFVFRARPAPAKAQAGNARSAPVLHQPGDALALARLDWPRWWYDVEFDRAAFPTHGAPSGYRSGIACAVVDCVAVGPAGADLLLQVPLLTVDSEGEIVPVTPTWTRLSDAGYDSVANAGRVFWFSGDGGRLGRLVLPAMWAQR